MAIPTVQYDETSPAGSDNISSGDNKIRELKTQIREIMAVDHEFTSTQTANTGGQHKQVTLQETADGGTGATGVPILSAQTVSGAPELMYTNEADTDIQITNTTGINAPAITGVYAAANVAALVNIMGLVYPVGSIYCNSSDSTNPGTLLGVGTWVAMVDEVIVGKNSTGTFSTLGTVSEGSETHTLTESEMPAHTHTSIVAAAGFGGTDGLGSVTSGNTGSTGGGGAHNNIQPSYVAYMWRRTA